MACTELQFVCLTIRWPTLVITCIAQVSRDQHARDCTTVFDHWVYDLVSNPAGMCSCFCTVLYAKICWSPFALLSIIGIFKLSDYLDICMLSYVSHSRLKDNTIYFFSLLSTLLDAQYPRFKGWETSISVVQKLNITATWRKARRARGAWM